MEDRDIVDLYFQRDEQAISLTSSKYQRYCMQIAMNILENREDSEECVNDAYLAAWNSIPPNRPERLSAYLGKLTRNLSLNRLKSMKASKRGGGEFALSLDELEDCVAENIDDTEQLGKYISEFLFSQPKDVRQVFVRRYFYSDSIADISKLFGMSESRIKSMLHRTRQRLQSFLAERDINI